MSYLNPFFRVEMVIGKPGLAKLAVSKVAVFGIGGVGSYAAEALIRSGIGELMIVDHDRVDITNLNRQVHALHSTVGKPKVEVMTERLLDINPRARIIPVYQFYDPEHPDLIPSGYDYIVDAIDTVKSKISLIMRAKEKNIPVVSSMGAGNKLDPTKLEVGDISETRVCPLARTVRRELRKLGITSGVKVVYSTESIPEQACSYSGVITVAGGEVKKRFPGSTSFVPPAAGLILASVVVRDLLSYV